MDAWNYGDRSLELGMPVWVLWAIAFCGMLGVLWGSIYAMWIVLRTGAVRPHSPSSDKKDKP
jgi:hypothetical protein